MTSLKVKTKAGLIQTLVVEQLLEVDGRKFEQQEELNTLVERIERLENLIVPIEMPLTETVAR